MISLKPGMYENIPFGEYLSWDAVSNSQITRWRRSPRHSQARWKEETKAMKLGSLIHEGVLEPANLGRNYAVMPDFHLDPENLTSGKNPKPTTSKNSIYYKERVAEWTETTLGGRIPITQDEWDTQAAIVEALYEDPKASQLFCQTGLAEVSIIWEDRRTQLMCKGRVDLLCPDHFLDLKTTKDCRSFSKSVADLGYHRQAAFYMEGLLTLGINALPWFVAVEKEDPYGVMAAPMSAGAMDIGRQEIHETLGEILEYKGQDILPGYVSPAAWDLPRWYGGGE